MQTQYFVNQRTGSAADTLEAFGFAALISTLAPTGGGLGLTISDMGDSYVITLTRPLDPAWYGPGQFIRLYRPLNTAKARSPITSAVDYEMHKQRNRAYFEARKKHSDEETLRELGVTAPDRDWPIWALINQMSARNSYNSLAEQWEGHADFFPELVSLILDLYAERFNHVDAAEQQWTALAKVHGISGNAQAAQLQVVNPGMGKGGNRSKASGLSIGGLKGFWIPEYLKFAGLYEAALPRTVQNSKDRKSYVVRPRNLQWRTHRQVFRVFQQTLFAATSIKLDIRAALHYCQVYLKQWLEGQADDGDAWWEAATPSDHVESLETIFFKDMGSAHATLNLSRLRLPTWVAVDSRGDAITFKQLLDEHSSIINGLDEKKGDQYELLRLYRDFLSGQQLREFFRFTERYGPLVLRSYAARDMRIRRFTLPNLEVLVMAHDERLRPIFENEGFQRVAAAIRSSTVTPQFFKAKGNPGPYEIRYGLSNEILRNASYPREFAQALGHFMASYSQENVRVLERFKGQPPFHRVSITVSDLEQVFQLVDEYDSETIAHLLVAAGYARDPKVTPDDDAQPDAASSDESVR